MKAKSLRSSMQLLFIISIFIPFFVISSIFSYFYSQQLLDNNKTNISNTLASISEGIGIYISELDSIADVPYYYTSVLSTMQEINNEYSDSINVLSKLQSEKNFRVIFLKQIYNSTQNISNVTFFPTNNEQNYAYIINKNSYNTKVEKDNPYKSTEWYALLQEDEKAALFYPTYEETTEKASSSAHGKLTAFSYITNVLDVDTNKIIGILKVDTPAKAITKFLRNVKLSSGSSLSIVDSNGVILYSNTVNPTLKALQNINELTSIQRHYYQSMAENISNTDYQLVYLSSTGDVIRYQLFTYFIIFIVMLLTIVISYVIYRYRTNQISQSVSSITASFRRIETGDLTTMPIISKQKEFIDISNALNHMVERLNEYIIKEYKASLSQHEAEYMALQAQINPHFLYNTLNGFIGLNRMGEKRLLEQSILRLTHLFQYTCNSSTTTTVASEISFIKQYLELQTLKYDNRLTFSICMNEDTEEIIIPKLLLQPLIENSIVHGLEPTDKQIHIQIYISYIDQQAYGKYLLIYICDNGIGFDSNRLNTHKNVGLSNVCQRLEYCSPHNLFQIRSVAGEGTYGTILIKI